MPQLVRSENDLPTLRIRLERTSREAARAVFEVMRGTGEPMPAGSAWTHELGVPDEVTSSRDVAETRFALPVHAVEQIRAAVLQVTGGDDPPVLWLELAFPRGYLHLVPWERLLSVPLGRPVLRLPNFTLRPRAPGDSLRLVLCASQPAAKAPFPVPQLLAMLADRWSTSVDRRVSIHVFSDLTVVDEARLLLASQPNVVLHDPRDAASYPPPPRTHGLVEIPGELSSPWLRWIGDALEGKAIDVVHFVGHGYLSGDRGALALASTPIMNTDTRWSRFVGATELAGFLSQVGAWSLALSGPPRNYCPAALRDLADVIAQGSPGITLAHELGQDADLADLSRALRMIYSAAPPEAPMPTITCWTHPGFVAFPESGASELVTADGHSTLISASTQDVLRREDTPAWVAAGARALETLQAEWVSGASGPTDPDAVAALRNVAELFNDQVRSHTAPSASGA